MNGEGNPLLRRCLAWRKWLTGVLLASHVFAPASFAPASIVAEIPPQSMRRCLAWRKWLAGVLLASLVFAPATFAAASFVAEVPPPSITLLYSDEQEVLRQFADHLESQLQKAGYPIKRLKLDGLPNPSEKSDLLIAVGRDSLAALTTAPPPQPVLAVLIARDQFLALRAQWPAGHPLSAIYHDPPPLRQLLLGQALLPGANDFGFIYRNGRDDERQAIAAAAERLQVQLHALDLGDASQLPSVLRTLLQKSDAIIANTDPLIYNAHTLKTVLMAAYRQEKTLIGSTPAFVKAGSLATTFSSHADISREILEWLDSEKFKRQMSLPEPHHAQYFDVMLNHEVAYSLGLQSPDPQRLKTRITEQEKNLSAAPEHQP